MEQILTSNVIFFSDSLKKGKPYISEAPRNHESLFLITKGALLYEKNGEQTVVPSGHVGYISRGSKDWSGPYKCDEVSYIAINFNFDNNSPAPGFPFPTDCSSGVRFPYEKLLRIGLEHFSLKQPGYEAVCSGLAMQIIGYLIHENALPTHNRQKSDRIAPALNYINDNFDDAELQIPRLSELCGMSEKHFRRIFTSVYGQTPYAFLQSFRIGKAEVLLLNTGKSISEIAEQCGFSDVYSFSHCFKKHNNLSPAAYRERNKA